MTLIDIIETARNYFTQEKKQNSVRLPERMLASPNLSDCYAPRRVRNIKIVYTPIEYFPELADSFT